MKTHGFAACSGPSDAVRRPLRRVPAWSVGACLALAALLGACGSSVKLDDRRAAPVESRNTTPGAAPAGAAAGGVAGGAGQSNVALVDLVGAQGGASAAANDMPRTIYFDFDSYVVRDDFRTVIELHARLLGADRKKRVLIEGHTDERGGSEYNLALGQRRAEAVARALALLGVQDGQLEPVSFGKERPAQAGSDEAAWAKNRRAELKERP